MIFFKNRITNVKDEVCRWQAFSNAPATRFLTYIIEETDDDAENEVKYMAWMLPIYFEPYPDEQLSSWINRLAEANGMSLLQFREFWLDEKRKCGTTIFEGMFWKSKLWMCFPDLKEILFNHTIYWSERFIRKESKTAADIHVLLYNREDPLYDIPGKRSGMKLRLCPECLKEDYEAGRFPYFRTWHSYENVTVCAKHHCALLEVDEFHMWKNDMMSDKYPEWNYNTKLHRLPEGENAIKTAEEMYEIYKHPLATVPEWTIDEKELDELLESRNLILIENFAGLLKVECKMCGTKFFTTPHALRSGRDCPVCELEQDIPKKMLATVPGYELVRDINKINEGECLRHLDCGNIRKMMSVYKLVWNGARCSCEHLMTKEKLSARYHLKEYKIISFKITDSICWKTVLTHKKCGHSFEVTIYPEKREIICPYCESFENRKSYVNMRKKNEELFCEHVKQLTGDDYIVVGKYVNCKTPIELIHNKCGNVFLCQPTNFMRGQRCNCDAKPLSKDDIYALLQSFEQNFTILDNSRKNESWYTIQFNNTGEVVRLTPRQIRQEATCLCEPRYFTRKKKEEQDRHD